jgi:formate-dependent nitrite reductase membrane component NrfD
LLVAHAQGVRIASTEERLKRFDRITLILELIVLGVFVISLGAVAQAFLSVYGVLMVLGVVGVGILMPLRMARDATSSFRASAPPRDNAPRDNAPRDNVATASILVLFGGFVLRVVVLLGSDQVHVAGTQVFR